MASKFADAFSLTTKAEKRGDRWILNGQKLWITNGAEAGVFVVFANADPSAGYRGIMNKLAEIETEQPATTVFVKDMRALARQFQFEAMGRQLGNQEAGHEQGV